MLKLVMRRRGTKARADGGKERNINSQRWKETREKGQGEAGQGNRKATPPKVRKVSTVEKEGPSEVLIGSPDGA